MGDVKTLFVRSRVTTSRSALFMMGGFNRQKAADKSLERKHHTTHSESAKDKTITGGSRVKKVTPSIREPQKFAPRVVVKKVGMKAPPLESRKRGFGKRTQPEKKEALALILAYGKLVRMEDLQILTFDVRTLTDMVPKAQQNFSIADLTAFYMARYIRHTRLRRRGLVVSEGVFFRDFRKYYIKPPYLWDRNLENAQRYYRMVRDYMSYSTKLGDGTILMTVEQARCSNDKFDFLEKHFKSSPKRKGTVLVFVRNTNPISQTTVENNKGLSNEFLRAVGFTPILPKANKLKYIPGKDLQVVFDKVTTEWATKLFSKKIYLSYSTFIHLFMTLFYKTHENVVGSAEDIFRIKIASFRVASFKNKDLDSAFRKGTKKVNPLDAYKVEKVASNIQVGSQLNGNAGSWTNSDDVDTNKSLKYVLCVSSPCERASHFHIKTKNGGSEPKAPGAASRVQKDSFFKDPKNYIKCELPGCKDTSHYHVAGGGGLKGNESDDDSDDIVEFVRKENLPNVRVFKPQEEAPKCRCGMRHLGICVEIDNKYGNAPIVPKREPNRKERRLANGTTKVVDPFAVGGGGKVAHNAKDSSSKVAQPKKVPAPKKVNFAKVVDDQRKHEQRKPRDIILPRNGVVEGAVDVQAEPPQVDIPLEVNVENVEVDVLPVVPLELVQPDVDGFPIDAQPVEAVAPLAVEPPGAEVVDRPDDLRPDAPEVRDFVEPPLVHDGVVDEVPLDLHQQIPPEEFGGDNVVADHNRQQHENPHPPDLEDEVGDDDVNDDVVEEAPLVDLAEDMFRDKGTDDPEELFQLRRKFRTGTKTIYIYRSNNGQDISDVGIIGTLGSMVARNTFYRARDMKRYGDNQSLLDVLGTEVDTTVETQFTPAWILSLILPSFSTITGKSVTDLGIYNGEYEGEVYLTLVDEMLMRLKNTVFQDQGKVIYQSIIAQCMYIVGQVDQAYFDCEHIKRTANTISYVINVKFLFHNACMRALAKYGSVDVKHVNEVFQQ